LSGGPTIRRTSSEDIPIRSACSPSHVTLDRNSLSQAGATTMNTPTNSKLQQRDIITFSKSLVWGIVRTLALSPGIDKGASPRDCAGNDDAFLPVICCSLSVRRNDNPAVAGWVSDRVLPGNPVDRGPMRDIAIQSRGELRLVVGVDLRVVPAPRDRYVGQAPIDERFSGLLLADVRRVQRLGPLGSRTSIAIGKPPRGVSSAG
jgi:hypothetical protein